MARLLITKGLNAGVTYELGGRTRIGRLGENEIQVPDPNVSRLHAEVVEDGNVFTIFDRGSKNGVLINGQEIAEKALSAGDEIIIGGSTFIFNPDFHIQNSRYSNNSVLLLEPQDGSGSNIITLDGTAAAGDSAGLVEAIASIFSGPPGSLATLTEHIASNLMNLFGATGTAVFARENENVPLHPIQVVPASHTVFVDNSLLMQCVAEKVAIAVVETISAPPGSAALLEEAATPVNGKSLDDTGKRALAKASKQDNSAGTNTAQTSTTAIMVAPMISGDDVVGTLLIVRDGDKPYEKQDLALLQSIATIACHSIESVRMSERARIDNTTSTLDTDQRAASTRSLRMQEIYNSAKRSAESAGTVLITGENGTGKETLARFIHDNGSRSTGPFVVFNCAAIPVESFETELYGSESVTDGGAINIISGKVEEAQGGTLFLCEVGELDLSVQPKLLRFIQDRAYYRKGGKRAVQSNVRIIASATVDLAAAVRAGKFREDLWYRLNVVPFLMPPLRERREDIGPLLDFFINKHSNSLGRKVLGANDTTIALLQKYDWPGNIRELNNAVERAVLLAENKVLSIGDFAFIEEARRRLNSQADLERKRDTKPLAEVERQHIMIALKKHNFNQARAAEALGLHRNTLRNKIIEYGIEIAK